MDDTPSLVGREVVAVADDGIVDLTVELTGRRQLASERRAGCLEPADKGLVRLRGDRRGAAELPTMAYLESGGARQLAAALLRAADMVDDLDDP